MKKYIKEKLKQSILTKNKTVMCHKIRVIIMIFSGLCLLVPAGAQQIFKTDRFQMEINSKCEVVQMTDLATRINYVPEANHGYLVRVKSVGKEIVPMGLKVQKNILVFSFGEGIELQVEALQKKEYLRFVLKKVVHPEKIEAVLWGPFTTIINETIGEVVGVVRNKDFAIGIQALNPKTTGGKIVNDEGSTGGVLTASQEKYGSAMQAFCMNHGIDRVMTVWNLHKNVPVKKIDGYSMEGSAIALFGSSPENVLSIIGKIEVAEGLPHPVYKGEWTRSSKVFGKPYLICSFSEQNFDEMLNYTERLGFYSIYHSHVFDTWGHFTLLKDLFPHGWDGMKQCVEKAKAKGILVGTHTLTNFITTNDPFVTTDANSGLMAAGISALEKDIDENSTDIIVDNYDYFAQVSTLNSLLIGNEIIRYQEVTPEKPYTLKNCIRGAFGTIAVKHTKGEQAKKLMDFPYKTLFPDWPMQHELINNMARFFNETGVSQLDFDGHEGTCYTGHGDYAINYFADEFLKRVNHFVVNGSSNISHYYWHLNSYINWGEPWYASFRESQSTARFEHQPFYERNYMPNMLGWFLLTPSTFTEDIEWMMARAAGYNAGYALVADYASLKNNPNTDIIIQYIRTWEEAKELDIFSEDQKSRLKDPEKDFHLEKTGANEWKLQNFSKFRFEHQKKILQPGEPANSKWEFSNNYDPQLLYLQLLVTGGEGASVENIALEIDNFFSIKIPGAIKKGQTLVWDSSGQMKLYNEKGQFIRTIDIERNLPELKKGKHVISIDAASMEGEEPLIKGIVKLKADIENIIKK
jgi:hypothetical protein